jgi:Ca2+-binding RTX toxin-like protein
LVVKPLSSAPEKLSFNLYASDGFTESSRVVTVDVNVAASVYGTDANNYLTGSIAPDLMFGYRGNDTILGHNGDDSIYGDSGVDFLYGENGNDVLYGGTESDVLVGGDGDDTLYGEAGGDMLATSSGYDALYGGAGSDQFMFTKTSGIDTIYDFVVGVDKLNVSLLKFTKVVEGMPTGSQLGILHQNGDTYLQNESKDFQIQFRILIP